MRNAVRTMLAASVLVAGCARPTPTAPSRADEWNMCEHYEYSSSCSSWRWEEADQRFVMISEGSPGTATLSRNDDGSIELLATHDNGWRATYVGTATPGGFQGTVEAVGASGTRYSGTFEALGALPPPTGGGEAATAESTPEPSDDPNPSSPSEQAAATTPAGSPPERPRQSSGQVERPQPRPGAEPTTTEGTPRAEEPTPAPAPAPASAPAPRRVERSVPVVIEVIDGSVERRTVVVRATADGVTAGAASCGALGRADLHAASGQEQLFACPDGILAVRGADGSLLVAAQVDPRGHSVDAAQLGDVDGDGRADIAFGGFREVDPAFGGAWLLSVLTVEAEAFRSLYEAEPYSEMEEQNEAGTVDAARAISFRAEPGTHAQSVVVTITGRDGALSQEVYSYDPDQRRLVR